MRAISLTITRIVAACAANSACAVHATGTAPAAKTGEHPAIVARRVIDAQGYDYASKFYPRPAWLYLCF